ncbi:mersacidin/lichenicidin family type 2 lantibiotic [Kibdelosporangium lantanae]|uniref:Mersacidin/lichenicidin family type 2 lantibiotic n=1 Tax=Kibdelosporangium lantanae TaxID=1497396 RepID=A0ABW3MA49_9PSEU
MHETVRSWKDPEFRASLGVAPEHPSGVADLRKVELHEISTAAGGTTTLGAICLTIATFNGPIFFCSL